MLKGIANRFLSQDGLVLPPTHWKFFLANSPGEKGNHMTFSFTAKKNVIKNNDGYKQIDVNKNFLNTFFFTSRGR